MTGVAEGEEPDAAGEGADEVLVELLVEDGAAALVVQRENRLAKAVRLLTAVVPDLVAVAAVHEDEGVPRSGARDQPLHGAIDVRLGWDLVRVSLLLVEHEDVVLAKAEAAGQTGGHVPRVGDTPAELAPLSSVVDADKDGPLLS